MDRKKVLIVVASIVASLAITTVTARSLTWNTPLYTLRMEQQSNKMNFLPTEMNEFVYSAEHGYNLTYEVLEYCSAEPLVETVGTCSSTCPYVSCAVGTCSTCGGNTCDDTSCQPSCWYTCWETCDDWTCNPDTCKNPC